MAQLWGAHYLPGESAAALPGIDPIPFCSGGSDILASASLGHTAANQCSKIEPASSMNCFQAFFVALLCHFERPSDRYIHLFDWRLGSQASERKSHDLLGHRNMKVAALSLS